MRITHFSPNAVGMVDERISLAPARRAGLDAAVLRPSALAQIHAPEHLDAADRRDHHRRGQFEHLVQHAVDAEAHPADLAPRLQVDVGGALLVGVLQQPVDDVDDVVVVCVDVARAAQFHQLLEAGRVAAALAAVLLCAAHRAGDAVELHRVAVQVERVGDHQLDFPPQQALDVRQPVQRKRLAGGDAHAVRAHFHRQDPVPAGVGVRDHVGDLGDHDPGRIDAQVGAAAGLGQPLGQRLQAQLAARAQGRGQLEVGQQYQRMHRLESAHVAALARVLGVLARQQAAGLERATTGSSQPPRRQARGVGGRDGLASARSRWLRAAGAGRFGVHRILAPCASRESVSSR